MCLEKQNAQDYWLFHHSEPQQCRPLLQIAFPFVFHAGQCVLLGLLPIFLVEMSRFILPLQQQRGTLPTGIHVTSVNPTWTKCSVAFPEAQSRRVCEACEMQSLGASALATLTLDNCSFSWVAVLGSCACTCVSFQHPASRLARGGCVGQHTAGHRALQVPELSRYSEAGCNLLVYMSQRM